ncbi:MAG: 3'-5' exonuclease [Patescibacteria group bacterium]
MNTEYESYTLRFCSRCTEVIIKNFHNLVAKFNLNDPIKKRIQKEYICYIPDKADDSKLNQKIHFIKNCPVGMIAYKISDELKKLIESQKIKEVLVIGEGRSCEALLKTISRQLKNYGFKNVDYRGNPGILPINQNVVDAYKFLAKDNMSVLGWRILGDPQDDTEKKQHLENAKLLTELISGTPSKLEKIKPVKIIPVEIAIEDWGIITNQDEAVRKELLIRELKQTNLYYLPRPLSNLDITVCNILNSKGLGADIVFLIGFDQGKFPSKKEPTESEIYQMLVATTRTKKRLYLINTINSRVSNFFNYLDVTDLAVEEVKI